MTAQHTQTRVAFATIVGTSIEWYDYFLYAAASGLIFNQLFFGPLGSTMSTMVAFATVGISFLFRPPGSLPRRSLRRQARPAGRPHHHPHRDGCGHGPHRLPADL
jgi:hypothetical protein